jgi:hypothetical protein
VTEKASDGNRPNTNDEPQQSGKSQEFWPVEAEKEHRVNLEEKLDLDFRELPEGREGM